MHTLLKYIGCGAIFTLLAGCTDPNEVVERSPSGEFSTSVLPIFEHRCGGATCHGGGELGFGADLDLTSFEGVLRGSKYGAVVIPGMPFMSHLVQTINRTDTTISPISSLEMPAGRDPLPAAELQAIIGWIGRGAEDGNGSRPFPEPRPRGKVLFTSQSVDLVGVLDIQTGLVIRYVQAGNALPFTQPPQAPHTVQVDDQGRYYYVTLISANVLRKYDARTDALLGEVGVGLSPAHVVITADGSKAYVTNFSESAGQVFVINTSSMTVDRIITHPLMRKTHGARLSHDGRYLYVGNNVGDLLTIIDTRTDSVMANLDLRTGLPSPGSFVCKPYQIAVRNDDRFIYITCNGSLDSLGNGAVSVFERIGDTFTFAALIPVGRRPLQCEVTRDGRFLYVCNQGSGTVSVINTAALSVTATIDSVGPQPHGVDITEDDRLVFVTCENVAGEPPHHPLMGSKAPGFIAVIDAMTNRVVRRVEVGGFAAGVAITPGRGN
jgi:YVTN family beta-propeller protein